MDNSENQALNPWISIWIKPRLTIQRIVDSNPKYMVHVLASVYGFIGLLNAMGESGVGDHLEWPVIFIAAAPLGVLYGLIVTYITGALIYWTGKWIHGKATFQEVLAAIAWSYVPIIWTLLLLIPELAILGQEFFTTASPTIESGPFSVRVLLYSYESLKIIIIFWSIFVTLQCLGQVQGFSAWKALGNLLLPFIVFVPLAVIAAFVTAFINSMS